MQRKLTNLGAANLCKRTIDLIFEETKDVIDSGQALSMVFPRSTALAPHASAFTMPDPRRNPLSTRIGAEILARFCENFER
jgi:hypothetical protein